MFLREPFSRLVYIEGTEGKPTCVYFFGGIPILSHMLIVQDTSGRGSLGGQHTTNEFCRLFDCVFNRKEKHMFSMCLNCLDPEYVRILSSMSAVKAQTQVRAEPKKPVLAGTLLWHFYFQHALLVRHPKGKLVREWGMREPNNQRADS